MKPTHGGTRSGAGRKPRATPRQAVTIRLEPDDAARLRAICTDRGISQADWLSEKINFDPYEAIDDAAQLLAEIMRDDVNPQDESEKWIRAYAPHYLFPENAESIHPNRSQTTMNKQTPSPPAGASAGCMGASCSLTVSVMPFLDMVVSANGKYYAELDGCAPIKYASTHLPQDHE